MKLASVTFHGDKSQVGGAQIPALAFKKWCGIFGISCDYLASPSIDELCEYTGVFFCTPPNWELVKHIDNYSLMIHTEFDPYSRYVMNKAKSIVCIDSLYWSYPNSIEWHPCTLPEMLLNGSESFPDWDDRAGTIYSARVSTWKNANVLKAYTNLTAFNEIYGPVSIYGKANNSGFGRFVKDTLGCVQHIDSVYDINSMALHHKRHKFFWDVSGSTSYTADIKRLNLSCFEAMKSGCIPIVNMDFVPDEVKDFCIDFREVHKEHDFNSMLRNMVQGAVDRYYGLAQIRQNVLKIIESIT